MASDFHRVCLSPNSRLGLSNITDASSPNTSPASRTGRPGPFLLPKIPGNFPNVAGRAALPTVFGLHCPPRTFLANRCPTLFTFYLGRLPGRAGCYQKGARSLPSEGRLLLSLSRLVVAAVPSCFFCRFALHLKGQVPPFALPGAARPPRFAFPRIAGCPRCFRQPRSGPLRFQRSHAFRRRGKVPSPRSSRPFCRLCVPRVLPPVRWYRAKVVTGKEVSAVALGVSTAGRWWCLGSPFAGHRWLDTRSLTPGPHSVLAHVLFRLNGGPVITASLPGFFQRRLTFYNCKAWVIIIPQISKTRLNLNDQFG